MTDALRDELVALTCAMVRVPSSADRPEQLAAAIDYVEQYLRAIPGLHLERSIAGGKPALVATLRETRSPAVMLNGHLDVVVGRAEQFEPQLRAGRIYGRGAQDMKGSVAVMLRLLKELAARPERPDVGFQFVSDEEIGGALGTGRLLSEGWRCGFMLCLEPTNLDILHEHKGAMWVELRLPGAPAHGSRPWEGRNPVPALVAGLAAIAQRFPTPQQEEWCTTVTPTVIRVGAGSRNQVPPAAELTLDIRYIPAQTPEQISAALRECFPTAEVLVDEWAEGLSTDPNSPEVQRLARIVGARRGRRPRFFREHFATDARYYSGAGLPAVCIGPTGAGLHSDEEWVEIESLVELYDILFTFLTEA